MIKVLFLYLRMLKTYKNLFFIKLVMILSPLLTSCQNSYQKTENQNAKFTLEIKNALNFSLINEKTAYSTRKESQAEHTEQGAGHQSQLPVEDQLVHYAFVFIQFTGHIILIFVIF